MNYTDKILVSNLLKEVKDKDLQNILRQVIFSNDNIRNIILKERPELKSEKNVLKKYL